VGRVPHGTDAREEGRALAALAGAARAGHLALGDDLESSAPTLGAARPAARGARGRRVRFSDETGEVAEARRHAGPVSHPLL